MTQKAIFYGNMKRYHSTKSTGQPGEEHAAATPALTCNQQLKTWVEFPKSISVLGFETGQTTKMTIRTKTAVVRLLKAKRKGRRNRGCPQGQGI